MSENITTHQTETFRRLAWLLGQHDGPVALPTDLGEWAIREWTVDGVTKVDAVPLSDVLDQGKEGGR